MPGGEGSCAVSIITRSPSASVGIMESPLTEIICRLAAGALVIRRNRREIEAWRQHASIRITAQIPVRRHRTLNAACTSNSGTDPA